MTDSLSSKTDSLSSKPNNELAVRGDTAVAVRDEEALARRDEATLLAMNKGGLCTIPEMTFLSRQQRARREVERLKYDKRTPEQRAETEAFVAGLERAMEEAPDELSGEAHDSERTWSVKELKTAFIRCPPGCAYCQHERKVAYDKEWEAELHPRPRDPRSDLHHYELPEGLYDVGQTVEDEIRAIQRVLAEINDWSDLTVARHQGRLAEIWWTDAGRHAAHIRGATGLRELLARIEAQFGGP